MIHTFFSIPETHWLFIEIFFWLFLWCIFYTGLPTQYKYRLMGFFEWPPSWAAMAIWSIFFASNITKAVIFRVYFAGCSNYCNLLLVQYESCGENCILHTLQCDHLNGFVSFWPFIILSQYCLLLPCSIHIPFIHIRREWMIKDYNLFIFMRKKCIVIINLSNSLTQRLFSKTYWDAVIIANHLRWSWLRYF